MTSRIPVERASRFLKWFNFNPVSMEIRWRYSLRGGWLYPLRGDKPRYTRKGWLWYLRSLDLVTVRGFLHILWNEIWVRHYIRWLNRHEAQG